MGRGWVEDICDYAAIQWFLCRSKCSLKSLTFENTRLDLCIIYNEYPFQNGREQQLNWVILSFKL